MEDFQQKIIKDNHTELVKLTKCSEVFLSHFYCKEILSEQEINKILKIGLHKDDTAQTHEFYDLIKTRTGSFKVLLKALEDTQQTGARELLGKLAISTKSRSEENPPKFCLPPKYLEPFLNDKNASEIIVVSPDTQLTCKRIFETVPQTIMHNSYRNFLSTISNDSMTKVKTVPVSVVDCGNDDFFTHDTGKTNARLVLVVSHYNVESFTNVKVYQENILWNELTTVFQHDLAVKVRGMTNMPRKDCLQLMSSMDRYTLMQLIQGVKPPLLMKTIPPGISYYIPRYLVSRDIITNEIFIKNKHDLVLVGGIEHHKLTELVNTDGDTNKLPDISSDIILKFPVKGVLFAVLEQSSHYEDIVKLNKNFADYKSIPIHYLQYKNKVLKWKKSHGNRNLVQKCISSHQVKVTEKVFVETFHKSKVSGTICISDTPGMGKSILVSHIASTLAKYGCKVAFVLISELIQEIKFKTRFTNNVTEAVVLDALGELICPNILGKKAMLYQPNFLHHLVLDAFDEISADHLQLGFKCLQILRDAFKYASIWVTTRPHILVEMEQILGIVGYTIKPFDEQMQTLFLSSYWSQMHDVDDTKLNDLKQFAKKCIESLKSRINKDEEDFAGVPLQCLLIAEVFGQSAKHYVETQKFVDLEILQITSLLDLYERLVAQKIEKFLLTYKKSSTEDVIELAHMCYAIDLMFPSRLRSLMSHEIDLESNDIVQDIFSAGVMEPKRTQYEPKPRFIHRTFAEFFVARFLMAKLSESNDDIPWDFLYNDILDTTYATFKFQNDRIECREFKYNVVCYFLDSMLKRYSIRGGELQLPVIKNRNNISLACAYSNSFNILHLLVYPRKPDNSILVAKSFNETFSAESTLPADQKCTPSSRKMPTSTEEWLNNRTLLEISAIRGHYSILEYMFNKQDLKSIIHTRDIFDLVCKCLFGSLNNSESVLKDKKQILRCFISHKDFFSSNDGYKMNSFIETAWKVHYLLLCDVSSLKIFNWKTLVNYVHINLTDYNCDQIICILDNLSETNKMTVKYLCNYVEMGDAVVLKILSTIKIEAHFADYLKKHKIMLNCGANKFIARFQAAVKSNQSSDVLSCVLEYSDFGAAFAEIFLWCSQSEHWLGTLALFNHAIKSQKSQREMFVKLYKNKNCKKFCKEASGLLEFCLNNDPAYLKNKSFLDYILTFTPFPSAIVQQLCRIVENIMTSNKIESVDSILMYLLRNCSLGSLTDVCCCISKFKKKPAKDVKLVSRDQGGVETLNPLFDLWFQKLNSEVLNTNAGETRSCYGTNQPAPSVLEDIFMNKNVKDTIKCAYIKKFLEYFTRTGTPLKLCQREELIEKESAESDCVFIICETLIQEIIKISPKNVVELLKTMIKFGACLNTVDEDGETPLFKCRYRYNYNFGVWNLLVANGGNPFYSNANNITPLAQLIIQIDETMFGNVEKVLFGALSSIRTHSSALADFICATIINCSFKTLSRICDWCEFHYPSTPIGGMKGVYFGVQITPLDAALTSCNGDSLEYIYNKGCTKILNSFLNLNLYPRKENMNKYWKTLDLIFNENPQMREVLDNKLILLHKNLYLDIKLALVDLGCNVNVKDFEGNTPLHLAVKMKNPLLYVTKLVDKNADINVKNNKHENAFSVGLATYMTYENWPDLDEGLKALSVLLKSKTNIIQDERYEKFIAKLRNTTNKEAASFIRLCD